MIYAKITASGMKEVYKCDYTNSIEHYCIAVGINGTRLPYCRRRTANVYGRRCDRSCNYCNYVD